MSDSHKKNSKKLPGLNWLQEQLADSATENSIDIKDAVESFKVYISLLGLAATAFTGIGLIITFLGLAFTFFNAGQDRSLNVQRLADERLVKSIEQLSSDKIFVRISGIHSLKGVVSDSSKNKDAVTAALNSFIIIRSLDIQKSDNQQCPNKINTPKESNYIYSPPKNVVYYDLEAALIVLSSMNVINRDNAMKYDRTCLNLSGMKLAKINLENNDFRKSTLKNTDLSESILNGSFLSESSIDNSIFTGAEMKNTNLTSTVSRAANFESALLEKAIFTGSVFDNASFKKANLNGSDVERASFRYANFSEAILVGANLEGADFVGATISDDQVVSACNWDKAIYRESNTENQAYIQKLKNRHNPRRGSNCDEFKNNT